MIGGSKHKGSTSAGDEQSWRSLPGGQRRTRIKSPQARKRRQTQLLKLFVVFFVFFFSIGLLIWGIVALKNREEPIQIATPSKPVEKVLFDTNGVLPPSWLGTVIELRRDTTMMEIDIHHMKQQLEAHGQVKSASVQRLFPNALKIEVQEHEPVLRMRVMGPKERPELRIVSRAGTIYKGVGYPRATLSQLPYVVPYRHPEGGFKPLRGIDQVADLLEVTRRTQPNFYRTWQLVSLEHYSGDPDLPGQVIEVRTSMVPRIIFGFNTSFEQQLDRLAVILNYVQTRGNPAVKRIDLSLHGSAAVQFESGRISTF
ncbi:FtsQ-type POTRA domain-containing protein [Coraliomargarita sp. SDUM461004]|uniref:FtsQ-type POTRA domain-containing protein n=1 Tax=Thalassobacterium sedimentorum TaxID=3041258 RepID=A0ABU1ALD1_9BACT|nr:FtsQ-type POTRA domain-containing protein [Coraliomargarita sp. SDUM461004]MDQ8195600.1 FtsQ-type POTRA domain-containing protein [Coraliomargarita sp. SDUM461004]